MTVSDVRHGNAKVELIQGDAAAALLRDPEFRQAWSKLASTCMWSTSCQTWAFADAWLSVYQDTHEALLVIQRNGSELDGLLPLAIKRASGSIVHVGAHQAEYQVWLATEPNADSFIELALDALAVAYPGKRLELQYLPPGSPISWCRNGSRWAQKVLLQEKRRPLLALGPNSAVEESLRKKSNKSRINRLKKIAPLTLVQIKTREQLSAVIDTIADYCDLRQGAINSSFPFRDDPRKKEFCLRLLVRPGITHASALMLGDRVVAANIGLLNRTSVSLGIVVHSPFLAEHSPGKILILLLARELGQQGFSDFDLTPGGDMYKDRSADHSDTVYVLRVCFSRIDYLREAAKARVRAGAIHLLQGRSPVFVSGLKAIARTSLGGLLEDAIGKIIRASSKRNEPRYYTVPVEQVQQLPSSSAFRINSISDLLCYEPTGRSDRSKTQFLLDVLRNLEAGGKAYTLVENGVLLHCGWISRPQEGRSSNNDQAFDYPPASCLIWDDYTHPAGRPRDLAGLCLVQRLHDAAGLSGIETIVVKCDTPRADKGSASDPSELEFIRPSALQPQIRREQSHLNFGR
jgi:CelD/BcsL family acetyltransferase involved in cellulose biosynthesis